MTTKSNSATDVVTSVRLRPEEHAALRELAQSNRRSIAGEMRVAIDAHLRAADKPREVTA